MHIMRGLHLVLVCVLVCHAPLSADENVSQLAADGWWISYLTTAKAVAGQNVNEYTLKATYSLVGTDVVDGERCRWLEVNSVFSRKGQNDSVYLAKLLVSEKDLLESEEPVDMFKRAWLKVNDQDVRAATVGKDLTPYNTRMIVFPGAWQKTERIGNEKIIDYQRGRLTIPEARTRQVNMPDKTIPQRAKKPIAVKEVAEYTAWFDPKTSPAVATARIQRKIYYDDKLSATIEDDIVLQDHGTDAKSQLPENN